MEETIYDFDELKMYFGEDYWVTDKICIKQPSIGDIIEFGDSKFYHMLYLFCSNSSSHNTVKTMPEANHPQNNHRHQDKCWHLSSCIHPVLLP